MNIKQKTTMFLVAAMAMAGISFAYAPMAAADCAGVKTTIIGGDICADAKAGGDAQSSGIWAVLLLILNILTAGVGIAAVGGIVYGAIMYSSAGDKQDQTKKAMGIITNTVIGLISYGLMYLLLNFIIPGGIFK